MKCDVDELIKFLENIEANPQDFHEFPDLKALLKRQGAMAKMDVDWTVGARYFKYVGGALNTLRARANAKFPGGFADLDRLRVRALDSVLRFESAGSAKRTNTKAYYKGKHESVMAELEITKQTNMVLLQAISRVIFDLKQVRDTDDSGERKVLAGDMLQYIRSVISIRYPLKSADGVAGDTNVVEFKR